MKNKISENTNSDCSGTSSSAAQGSCSIGYSYEFITNGTDVTINFELLDTDKSGLVAYLWKQTPFSELQMNSSGQQRYPFSVCIRNLKIVPGTL